MNKRVVVTRAAHQAEKLAALLRAAHMEPILLPALEIIPPADPASLAAVREQIRNFDWLIVTSANGAQSLAKNFPPTELTHLQIAAIGPETASELRELGYNLALVPDEYVADALLTDLVPRAKGKRVLIWRAAAARAVLEDGLRAHGTEVTIANAYRTAAPANLGAEIRRVFKQNPPHAITFASSQTARNFITAMREENLHLPPKIVIASIGPVTSFTLRDLGAPVHVQPAEHTLAAMVTDLSKYFRDHAPRTGLR